MRADPTEMLDTADRTLRGDRNETLVAALVGLIHPRRRTMLGCVGRTSRATRSPPGPGYRGAPSPGLPLGRGNVANGKTCSTQLARGSKPLLCTDCLVEWSRDILAGRYDCANEACARMRMPRRLSKTYLDVLDDVVANDDVAVLLGKRRMTGQSPCVPGPVWRI
jgi:hypothetical protein